MGLARILVLMGLWLLAACAGPAEPKWASDAEVARAAYSDRQSARITLFTVVSNRNGWGAHTSLLINGRQRIIFDPAGTWYHPQLPERNDVHFGMSDAIVDFYVDYHTRITYHTIIQELDVSPQVAETLTARALGYGAVPKAQCSKSVSEILSGVPGFESIPQTWFPKQLSAAFGKLPGVRTRIARDNDPDDNKRMVLAPPALHAAR